MKRIRCLTVLKIALVLVLAVSITGVLWQQIDYRSGEQEYEQAEQIAGLILPEEPVPLAETAEPIQPQQTEQPVPEPPIPERSRDAAAGSQQIYLDAYAASLAELDLAALQAVNSEVVGWILIPDTDISFPLLQGTDNDYYLHYTWQNNWSSLGSIFVDYRNSGDLSDFHTVIYGHRMNNHTMFAPLHNYKQAGYWQTHPSVYLVDANGVHKYDIFAAYETATTETYQLQFADDAARQSYLDGCASRNTLDTGIVPTTEDRVITLSTCTGTGQSTRWVVQAVARELGTVTDTVDPNSKEAF